MLLGAFHNVSLREDTIETVREEAAVAAQHVRETEKRAGHDRTLVIGDFNLMPFDEAIVKARGFHAVMDRQVARVGARTVKFNQYPLFYNPMWGMMGDLSEHPSGTYYFHKAGQVNYYWHMYDQVLLRPSIVELFDPKNLRVLVKVGNRSLTGDGGLPDPVFAFDHLPVLLKLA